MTANNPNGADAYSVVTILPSASDVILDGFHITHGRSTFADATGPRGAGGGLYAAATSFFTIANCLFTDCSAYRGGGMFASSGGFHMKHSVFEGCTANRWTRPIVGGRCTCPE